ncbi:MAG: hypothetical protein IJ538_00040 [Clostridia bacterium]|nr:hypothetical protein [Clostridia bacterium]
MAYLKGFDLEHLMSFRDFQEIDTGNGIVRTSDRWNTESVKLIRKKDGTYSLGVDVGSEKLCFTTEIKLDENDVPYITGAEDYNEANCIDKVLEDGERYFGLAYGTPLSTIEDGACIKDRSVFGFVGKASIAGEKVRDYFSGFYHEAFLNKKGLAIILKLIQTPEMKAALDARFAPITEEEKIQLSENLKSNIDRYVTDPKNNHNLDYYIKTDFDLLVGLVNGEICHPDRIIKIDLDEFSGLVKENKPGQLGDGSEN